MNKEIFGCALLSVRVTMVLIQSGVKRRWIFWAALGGAVGVMESRCR
jgi:hypothetical protein